MGFFSWYTQDTNESISNHYSSRGALPCAMIDPRTWKIYEESNYEGYGVFGGKDFYELLAELNGKSNRIEGIDLEGKEGVVSPILVSLECSKGDDAKRFIGQSPKTDPLQGFFYEEEADDWDDDYEEISDEDDFDDDYDDDFEDDDDFYDDLC